MTPTEAAATLRALGWRCEPPEALAAPIPPPEVGQLWRASSGRIAPRTVTGFARRWGKDCVVYSHTGAGGETTHLPLVSWQAWARKAGARPVTAPHTAPAFQPAPTLAPDGEAAIAPPQAPPEVGQVWEAPSHVARTVAYLDGGHVLYRLRGYAGRVHAAKVSRWHAWVRRSGARVAP